MTKCLHCERFDLKSYPAHARVGFAHCKLSPVGQFVSVKREVQCKSFYLASAEVIGKREEWMQSKRKGESK